MNSILPTRWADLACPVIGMLHVPPLPGSTGCVSPLDSMQSICRYVLRDAATLVDGGVHGLMLENFGDVPFYPDRVPPATIAQMTALATVIREEYPDVPLGINVLRNDALAALAVAHAVGAHFIRVNVLCGARLTDQGLIASRAHELLREHSRLGATGIQIWADVDVKHSAPVAPLPLAREIDDTFSRGLADAVILTGSATGAGIDEQYLREASAAAGARPLIAGSGVTPATLGQLVPHVQGLVVGSALQEKGFAGEPVNRQRVRKLMTAWQQAAPHTSIG